MDTSFLPDKFDLEESEIFEAMQQAVDIVHKSQHKTNKVAASFLGLSQEGNKFLVSETNTYPLPLKNSIDRGIRFSARSGFLHAELCAILKQTDGWKKSYMAVTDPPCPNCMKNIVDVGARAVFIDHKGFEKDFFRRRVHDFNLLSKKIAGFGGVSLFKVYRKEKKIESLFVSEENGTKVEASSNWFRSSVADQTRNFSTKEIKDDLGETIAAVFVTDDRNQTHKIGSSRFTYLEPYTNKEKALSNGLLSGQFDITNSPLISLVIKVARENLVLDKNQICLTYEPMVSELIFMVYLGFKKVIVESQNKILIFDEQDIIEKLHKISS